MTPKPHSALAGMATAHLKARADAHPVRMKSFTSGLSGGVADSLDEAKAAFRAPWGAAPLIARKPRYAVGNVRFLQTIRTRMLGLSLSVDAPQRASIGTALIAFPDARKARRVLRRAAHLAWRYRNYSRASRP